MRPSDPDDLRAELRSWGRRQRNLATERDPLVQRSLKAGISIEEIHMSTGLARTTIDRIKKGEGSGEVV
jgi:DNA invertase Pin-like site-specific DNA recombinase